MTAYTHAALRLSDVGKQYTRFTSPRQRLKSLLWSQDMPEHWVLRHVSFDLDPGDCMGVVGDNGAGKSSLLKLIAGTISPSEGHIDHSGRITAILELGAGFHPDFSGRDNLRFSGRLIGLSGTDIARLEPEIIDFAELGDAIDRPVKSYSSGMVVRLAFALITAVEPDILIVDEALAVGDQHFQRKCLERIESFRKNGCTILFCSHSLYHVRHLCNKSVWLDKGQVRAIGETDSVLAQYEQHVRESNAKQTHLAKPESPQAMPPADNPTDGGGAMTETATSALSSQTPVNKDYALEGVTVENLSTDVPQRLLGSDLIITMRATGGTEPPSFGIMLEQVAGVGITSAATHAEGVKPREVGRGQWESRITFFNLPLHSGDYVLSAYLFDANGVIVCDERPKCLVFRHVKNSLTPGLLTLPHAWD